MTNQNGSQMWSKMLTEKFQVNDADKLKWVSEYAAIHEIHESQIGVNGGQVLPQAGVNGVGPVYATPLNTLGMGNPLLPGQVPAQGATPADFYSQHRGSGDIPVSTLPMALNIALMTIGLELVPVVPAKAPWAMLSYMDFPYAGGKLGRVNETSFDGKGDGNENKPIYIKVAGLDNVEAADIYALIRTAGADATVKFYKNGAGDSTFFDGVFKAFSMLDGGVIVEVKEVKVDGQNASIHDIFTAGTVDTVCVADGDEVELGTTVLRPDFAQANADFVDGFANFVGKRKNADGEWVNTREPMTRAENETGTGNTLGLRLFTKMVQMGAYEVTGTVTRQQLHDLPLYGVDAVGKIMEAMQNELTQHINARILERVFRLGVTNAVHQKRHFGVDLNLYLGAGAGDEKTNLAADAYAGIKEYTDVYGNNHKTADWEVKNTEVLTSAENLHTRQRRISSRLLAAANLIQVTGRRGRANWAVTNTQVLTALQDCSDYVVAPMTNNLAQDGTQNLYMGGSVAGLKIYVDPYMHWNDTRVCVGRKGNGNEPGVVFMPYILADQVSITAEGTMAPKMLINSRFAIVDAGFYPELQYYTFCIGTNGISLY